MTIPSAAGVRERSPLPHPAVARRSSVPREVGGLAAIVNVTPDSFYPESRVTGGDAAARIRQLTHSGITMIDVGAVSTRPGADIPPAGVEFERLASVWDALSTLSIPWSIDTFRAAVAARAIEAGAAMVNDVTGGAADPAILDVIAESSVEFVIMHTRGVGKEMAGRTAYSSIDDEIISELDARVEAATRAGVAIGRIWIDPGIGFAKTGEASIWAMQHLERFRRWGTPLYVGPSRKSFLGDITGRPAAERLAATLACVGWCLTRGVEMIRIHDAAEAADFVTVWRRLEGADD